LLQLLGHPLTENDRVTDLEFLSDVMEVQEDLITCGMAELRAHALRNSGMIQQQRALASQAFSSGRVSDAKAIVIKLQCAPCAHALLVAAVPPLEGLSFVFRWLEPARCNCLIGMRLTGT
jgi:hypothetical protein